MSRVGEELGTTAGNKMYMIASQFTMGVYVEPRDG